MLRTCTDKMVDMILLPIFAGNFAVFVLKQLFLYILYEKKSFSTSEVISVD